MPEAFKATLLILITQLPVAVGGWLWATDRVALRPLYAALLGGGYEMLVLAAGFAKKVWGKLEADAVEVVADRVRGRVRGFAPGFRRSYKRVMLDEHSGFNVRGLGLINTFRLKLEEVFVELRIDPTNPQVFRRNLVAPEGLAGNRPVWEFLRARRRGEPDLRALAVVGPPGSGKTTLLRHVALTLAANRQHRYGVRAYVPVLLYLRDHVPAVTRDKPPPLGALVQDYFEGGHFSATLRPPAGWFERQLTRGKCLVLLDGLDEVADVRDRRAVSAWVDAQIKSYPRSRFVLTARPQGYLDAPLERADVVLEVQPFNAAQVWKFVESWYLANEIMSSAGKLDAGVRRSARAEARDLMQRLRTAPALSALTVNPLLLTMIAMVHRYRGALPGSRVELYAEICEVLLERWRQVREVKDRFDLKAAQKLVVLRPLAAHMMGHKLRDITTEDALPVVTPPLARVGVAAKDAEDFLVNLQEGSSLLVEREAGRWSFAHLTFQEYLTASQWLLEKNAGLDWRELVGDGWWHETLRLYAAQSDATPLARACLSLDTVPALALAADFLEAHRELDPDVRRDIERRINDDLESDDPARRRLAAEVKLTRRLKSFQRIDDQREIDPDYITCAEYQLFLDETPGPEYFKPMHWTADRFPEGAAREPVAGMTFGGAWYFCQWLEGQHGGGVNFRLPTREEATEHQSATRTLGAWCLTKTAGLRQRPPGMPMFDGLVGFDREDGQRFTSHLRNLSKLPRPSLDVLSVFDSGHVDVEEYQHFEFTYRFPEAFFRAVEHRGIHRQLKDVQRDVEAMTRDLATVASDATTRHANGLRVAHIVEDLGVIDLGLTTSMFRAMVVEPSLINVEKAYEFVIAHALAADLRFILDAARALTGKSEKERPVAHALALSLERIVLALDDNDLRTWKPAKTSRIYEHTVESKPSGNRVRDLLEALALVLDAADEPVQTRVRRRFFALVFECFYKAQEEAWRLHEPASVWGWLARREAGPDNLHLVTALKLYWCLRIIEARERGELPAWEGLRVVREQVPEAELAQAVSSDFEGVTREARGGHSPSERPRG